MTFVERSGVRIHYETVWRHAGYIDGLNRFRCVLVDSRAHRGVPRGRVLLPALGMLSEGFA